MTLLYGHPSSPKLSPVQEIELPTMLPDDDTDAGVPLIQNNHGAHENEDIDDDTLDQESSSGNLFVYALTFSAGISGLLFGYEYVPPLSTYTFLLMKALEQHRSHILHPRLHRHRSLPEGAHHP
jgi:hypothetical protein